MFGCGPLPDDYAQQTGDSDLGGWGNSAQGGGKGDGYSVSLFQYYGNGFCGTSTGGGIMSQSIELNNFMLVTCYEDSHDPLASLLAVMQVIGEIDA